ncbi:MAG TPA: hypothetical protein EYG86_05345 [Crocinitomicaceae bacterium]|nr:hypothetical protein [Crocinitomicaceae bacterium]
MFLYGLLLLYNMVEVEKVNNDKNSGEVIAETRQATLNQTQTQTPVQSQSVQLTPTIPNELAEVQRELIDINSKLVMEVATCECDRKEQCDVFKMARQLAKVLKKMSNIIRA